MSRRGHRGSIGAGGRGKSKFAQGSRCLDYQLVSNNGGQFMPPKPETMSDLRPMTAEEFATLTPLDRSCQWSADRIALALKEREQLREAIGPLAAIFLDRHVPADWRVVIGKNTITLDDCRRAAALFV